MHYIAEPAEPEACSGEKLNFSLENWVIPIEVATYAPLSNFSVVDEIFFMVSSLILIFISLDIIRFRYQHFYRKRRSFEV